MQVVERVRCKTGRRKEQFSRVRVRPDFEVRPSVRPSFSKSANHEEPTVAPTAGPCLVPGRRCLFHCHCYTHLQLCQYRATPPRRPGGARTERNVVAGQEHVPSAGRFYIDYFYYFCSTRQSATRKSESAHAHRHATTGAGNASVGSTGQPSIILGSKKQHRHTTYMYQ